MPTSLSAESVREAFERLRIANLAFNRFYPGESGRRQPVHTVYGGAHLFKSDSAARLGAVAVRTFEEYAPDFTSFAKAIGLPGAENLPGSADQISQLKSQFDQNANAMRQEN